MILTSIRQQQALLVTDEEGHARVATDWTSRVAVWPDGQTVGLLIADVGEGTQAWVVCGAGAEPDRHRPVDLSAEGLVLLESVQPRPAASGEDHGHDQAPSDEREPDA